MADTTQEDALPGEPVEIALFPELASPVATASSRRRPPRWLAAVGLAALSALIGAGAATAVLMATDETTAPPAPIATGSAAEVAAAVLPSIVTVEVDDTDDEEFFATSSGSGVVFSADGTIVTNQHVVDGAIEVRVVFSDGRSYPATVLGADALTDLAVVQIGATGLTPIVIGSSQAMAIGDVAVAVGSPLGLEGGPSVTVGVVSAFDRRVTTPGNELFGMLQTDAPITRGSSGGALVDAGGRLIGITSAIGISDVGAEGLGFAIPVEMVQRITDEIIAGGAVHHAFLGIGGTTHFEEQGDGSTIPAGVEVAEVMAGTAAETAGLQVGDLIVAVEGEELSTMEQLVVRIRLYRVDDQVTVTLIRDGAEIQADVTLMERPEGV